MKKTNPNLVNWSPEEALHHFQHTSLHELGEIATDIRNYHNPSDRVTFIIDSNPNYTNICDADCTFCAFYRHPEKEDSYTLSIDEVLERYVATAHEKGVTTVLLQGGLNPEIPFEYYVELLERWTKEYPDVHPHLFSAPEIHKMSMLTKKSYSWVMQSLYNAGMRTFPGGGAEILANRVRDKFSSTKVRTEEWIEIHRAAHNTGILSTATMMYGHIEKDEEIISHLFLLQKLQAETGGFTAFIPWSFKPKNTPFQKTITSDAGPVQYLRILALSRIILNNIPHIQASWFSEGKRVGQMGLMWGADDFGGTLEEENVLKAADFHNKTNVNEVIHIIREAGFKPAQRTTPYKIIEENVNYRPTNKQEINILP